MSGKNTQTPLSLWVHLQLRLLTHSNLIHLSRYQLPINCRHNVVNIPDATSRLHALRPCPKSALACSWRYVSHYSVKGISGKIFVLHASGPTSEPRQPRMVLLLIFLNQTLSDSRAILVVFPRIMIYSLFSVVTTPSLHSQRSIPALFPIPKTALPRISNQQ